MRSYLLPLALLLALVARTAPAGENPPLRIAYSDWPGWVAWEIAIQKGYLREVGAPVEFVWMEYGPSMEAYSAGQVDAVTVTNGDALVTGATGRPSVGIILGDYSNGNDMIVGAPGVNSVADLAGKKIGLEQGFVIHLLLLKALEANNMAPTSVEIVNMSTNDTPQALAAGGLAAIGAWQPNSGQALRLVPGSRSIFSSADAPGLIYDLTVVSRESYAARKEDWYKVVKAWYMGIDFLKDPANRDEALQLLSARVEISPEDYAPLLAGTYMLTLSEALERWQDADGLGSVYGSSRIADAFNVAHGVYEAPLDTASYLSPELTLRLAREKGLISE